MAETYEDQLSRVRWIAGVPYVSSNDRAALTAVLARLDELESAEARRTNQSKCRELKGEHMTELTEEQFIARCRTAYRMGLATRQRLALMERWLDFVLRFEAGQMAYVADFLDQERHREWFGKLASDADGYATNKFMAILTHPCQKCGEDTNAWHTRGILFCEHKGE